MSMPKVRERRCREYAKNAFSKSLVRLRAAEATGDKNLVSAAREKATVAGVQYAATSQGEHDLKAMAAAQANIDRPERAGWFDSLARQGAVLRDSSNAVRDAYRSDTRVRRNVAREAALHLLGPHPYQGRARA